MTEDQKKHLLLVGAVALILLAVVLIYWQASRPSETITDFKKVPPKGAGKFDRGDGPPGGKM